MSPALMPTYARYDVAFERGEGPYLMTADGRRYLDFAAGIAVNACSYPTSKAPDISASISKHSWRAAWRPAASGR